MESGATAGPEWPTSLVSGYIPASPRPDGHGKDGRGTRKLAHPKRVWKEPEDQERGAHLTGHGKARIAWPKVKRPPRSTPQHSPHSIHRSPSPPLPPGDYQSKIYEGLEALDIPCISI